MYWFVHKFSQNGPHVLPHMVAPSLPAWRNLLITIHLNNNNAKLTRPAAPTSTIHPRIWGSCYDGCASFGSQTIREFDTGATDQNPAYGVYRKEVAISYIEFHPLEHFFVSNALLCKRDVLVILFQENNMLYDNLSNNWYIAYFNKKSCQKSVKIHEQICCRCFWKVTRDSLRRTLKKIAKTYRFECLWIFLRNTPHNRTRTA